MSTSYDITDLPMPGQHFRGRIVVASGIHRDDVEGEGVELDGEDRVLYGLILLDTSSPGSFYEVSEFDAVRGEFVWIASFGNIVEATDHFNDEFGFF